MKVPDGKKLNDSSSMPMFGDAYCATILTCTSSMNENDVETIIVLSECIVACINTRKEILRQN